MAVEHKSFRGPRSGIQGKMNPRPRELCLHMPQMTVGVLRLSRFWLLHGQGISVILQGDPAQSPLHRLDHARTRLKVDLEDTLGRQWLHMMQSGADRI
jgi:hypothetical protein